MTQDQGLNFCGYFIYSPYRPTNPSQIRDVKKVYTIITKFDGQITNMKLTNQKQLAQDGEDTM